MATQITIHPLPGTFQGRALYTWVSARRCTDDSWQEIKSWAAWQFEASEDDVDLREVFWGGEYGDDNHREALTVRGEIVGVFDDALTADDWAALLAADAAERAPTAPASHRIAAE